MAWCDGRFGGSSVSFYHLWNCHLPLCMFHANASADAGSPEYSFGTDPDTGMYSGGANVLAFSSQLMFQSFFE